MASSVVTPILSIPRWLFIREVRIPIELDKPRTLLWAGLLHEDEKLTERQVGAMISLTNVEHIMEQITEALTAALPEDTGTAENAVAPNPR